MFEERKKCWLIREIHILKLANTGYIGSDCTIAMSQSSSLKEGAQGGGGGGNGRKERGEMVSGRGNLRFRWVYSLFVLVYVLYASDSISEPNKEFMGNKLIESKNDRMIES